MWTRGFEFTSPGPLWKTWIGNSHSVVPGYGIGGHWLASLAIWWDSVRDPISKDRWRAIEEDTWCGLWHTQHASSGHKYHHSFIVYLLIFMYGWQCVAVKLGWASNSLSFCFFLLSAGIVISVENRKSECCIQGVATNWKTQRGLLFACLALVKLIVWRRSNN